MTQVTTSKFNVGDSVESKYGGFPLTIKKVYPTSNTYSCMYQHNDTKAGTFIGENLRALNDKPEKD